MRFLLDELAARGTRKIVIGHRPRDSAGEHGDSTDLSPMFKAMSGHAAMYLSGHDHDMQIMRPVGGVTQIVSGAGGREAYPCRSHALSVWCDSSVHGALRLTLRGGVANLAFVSKDGNTLRHHRIAAE